MSFDERNYTSYTNLMSDYSVIVLGLVQVEQTPANDTQLLSHRAYCTSSLARISKEKGKRKLHDEFWLNTIHEMKHIT